MDPGYVYLVLLPVWLLLSRGKYAMMKSTLYYNYTYIPVS